MLRSSRRVVLVWAILTGAATVGMLALVRSPSSAQVPQVPTPFPSSTITQPSPMAGPAGSGQSTYLRDCAWCHGNLGQGGDSGPALTGVGAASADFMLSTGRMPIPNVQEQPRRRAPVYSPQQIAEIVSFIASLGPGPAIPHVDPSAGSLPDGAELYRDNCAACHSSTGVGGALTSGLEAPGLMDATPRQIAEAVRLGGAGYHTGKMPRFGADVLTDHQLDSVVAYVLYLQHPQDRGGAAIGHLGPVAEGLVAWIGALLALVLLVRWIGKRSAT